MSQKQPSEDSLLHTLKEAILAEKIFSDWRILEKFARFYSHEIIVFSKYQAFILKKVYISVSLTKVHYLELNLS